MSIYRYVWILIVFLLLCISLCICNATVAGEDLNLNFIGSSITSAYNKFKKCDNFQDDFIAKTYRGDPGAEKLIHTTYFKRRSRSDGYFLSEMTLTHTDVTQSSQSSASVADRVTVVTPKYDFNLKANRPGEWYINRYVSSDSSDYTEQDKKNHADAVQATPYDSHYRSVTTMALPDFLSNSAVKILNISKSPTNLGCYRIEYAGAGDTIIPGTNKIPASITGWIDVKPDFNWSIVETEGTTKLPQGEAKTHNEFVLRCVQDVYFVEKHIQNTVSKIGNKVISTRVVTELNPRIQPSVDPKDFTLSAFGLPEPIDIAEATTRPSGYLYVWIFIIAFLFAAVAFCLRYLRNRTHATL